MKITGVELSSDNANVFSFGMSDVPSTDKYLIKTIIGLDADEIIRKFYGFGKGSDAKFFNFSIVKREIVMRIVLNPNYSVNETFAEIRDELYRAISSSRTGLINLLFTSGGATVSTLSGFITKFEVPYFSKVPELQLTIKSHDPMFRGYNPIELEPADLSNSNPVLISDSLSTAPHGFQIKVTFTTNGNTFTVKDDAVNPTWDFKVTPNIAFGIGDILYVSSEFGNKHVYVDRGGIITHLMDSIEPGSMWPIIFPGGNEFIFDEINDFDWGYIKHRPAYWGV